jgi:hypothetical protein
MTCRLLKKRISGHFCFSPLFCQGVAASRVGPLTTPHAGYGGGVPSNSITIESMRDLWRKTTALFWENPVLWLPVVCADLLAFCFTRLQKLLTWQLINSFLLSRSARTGQAIPPVDERAVITKAAFLGGPFVWGTYFLNTCLYTAAFVVTAVLVDALGQHLRPDLPLVLGSLRSRIRRILVFSIKLLALYALATVLLLQATTLAQKWKFPTTDLVLCFLVLAFVSIAYCMAPSGISLLRDAQLRSITPEYITWGRSFSILMVLASLAAGYFVPLVEQSLFVSPLLARGVQRLIIEAIASSAAAFPYVLLFISLSLIATNRTGEQEPAGQDLGIQPE